MTCKYLSIRQKNYQKKPFCRDKKEWLPQCNKECFKPRDYEPIKKSDKPIKPYSKKRAKAERERYSIFTNNLNLCIECLENKKEVAREDLHEIFNGKNRIKSMKYGLVVPFCRTCHDNKEVIKKWQAIGRQAFIKEHGEELFIKEFQTKKGMKE